MVDLKNYFLNAELWSELPPEKWIEHELPEARKIGLPLIVSLGYVADDIRKLAPLVRPFADAVELSTHYVGSDPRPMQDAIRAAKAALDVPVTVKLSPFRDVQTAALAAQEAGADGIVCGNSFGPALGIDIENGGRLWMGGNGYGWISGPALKPISLRAVYDVARVVDIPVIGVGGVTRGTDVVEYLMAGASAVQVCTAAITRGQSVYGKIATEFAKWMDNHHYQSISEIQGLTLRNAQTLMSAPPLLVPENCTGCNRCVTSCVYEALFLENKVIHIHEDRCTQCGLCLSRCASDALRVG
jgi:dihydroorotate dehydrogenase subfamily 1